MTEPKPPSGLQTAGKRLWSAITTDIAPGWSLDAREIHMLEQAAKIEDELHALEAAVAKDGPITASGRVHPALVEARQLRLVQLRLLGSIELSDPSTGSATLNGQRARKAASARWN